ncbi:MAG: cupin domain-containing protein [Gammaproteobacteria bacterium]
MIAESGSWDLDRDGPLTAEAMRRKLQQRGFDVFCYEYAPGTVFPSHTHAVEKIDAVLSGTFRITIAGVAFDLGPGQWLRVPAGTIHSAEVLGNESVVSLDAIARTVRE